MTSTNVRAMTVNGSSIFAGGDVDGVFLSTNNGANWNLVNNGLPSASYYQAFVCKGNEGD